MSTVELDSVFTVYADVEEADAYLDGSSHADNWRAITDDDTKARYLVTATRLLDRQLWAGDKTSEVQPLAWPRKNTGVTGVTDDTIPTDIISASIEMASALADGVDLQSQQNFLERVQSMSAGSVSITHFRGQDVSTRFPQIIHELLRKYMSGGTASYVPKSTGTDTETIFPIDLGYSTGGL